MATNSLPSEVLDLILGQLIEKATPLAYQYPDSWRHNVHHLCQARLVCRQWSSLATPHLFRHIDLAYSDKDVTAWDKILSSELVRHTRSLHVRTTPDDNRRDEDSWEVKRAQHKNVINCVKHIDELPSIEALHLQFSMNCCGIEKRFVSEDFQSIDRRREIFETVFAAIHNRRHIGRTDRPVRSLTIENLQNVPLPQVTSSDHFAEVMKDVNHLQLMVQEEHNEAGPDWDMHRVERRTFEPYLGPAWLAPIADHLVSLTLYFRDPWGSIPGYFDGDGLTFPMLKTLTLGNYVIAHHHQFDWVLNQTSLTTLDLDKCAIVSYISFYDRDEWLSWHVPAHDWTEHEPGSLGCEGEILYTFPGTWEPVFDAIRTRLSNLRDFSFHDEGNLFPVRREMLSAQLHEMRYCAFYGGWNFPFPCYYATSGRKRGFLDLYSSDDYQVNLAEEHKEEDERGFKALIEEIRAR